MGTFAVNKQSTLSFNTRQGRLDILRFNINKPTSSVKMRFSTAIFAGLVAVASAQDATTSSAPSTTSVALTPEQSAAQACLDACAAGDIDCESLCRQVPNPSVDDVNSTTECSADCDQGDGTEAATNAYAECVQSCIRQYYYTSTGKPAGAAATSTAGSSSEDDDDDDSDSDSDSDSSSSVSDSSSTDDDDSSSTSDADSSSSTSDADSSSSTSDADSSGSTDGDSDDDDDESGASNVVASSVVGIAAFLAAVAL